MRFNNSSLGLRSATKRRWRDSFILRYRFCVTIFGRLRNVCTVFEMHVECEPVLGRRNLNATAEEFEFILISKSSARPERLTVDLHRFVLPEWLNKWGAIEQVEQHHRPTAGSWQPQRTIAARSDAKRQVNCVNAPLAFNVSYKKMVETQIVSSQRTTTGPDSSSGDTRNSRRTSR